MEESKIKALFFAQYLGQEVYMRENQINPVKLWAIHLSGSDNGYLVLRDIIDLRDEEAQILTQIAFNHPGIEDFNPDECWTGEGDSKPDNSTWLEVGCRCWEGLLNMSPSFTFSLMDDDGKNETVYNQLGCTDYLRSIGILLPFTYLNEENKPVTLSPEEIIARKWAVIIS